MTPRFIYIETYGCSANQNNSEIIRGICKQAGLDFVENEKIADIIILNTCIVKGPTENSIKRRILDLQALNKPIIVAGCMPEVRKKFLERKNIYLLGINHIKDITKLIRRISENKYNRLEFLEKKHEIKLQAPKIKQNKIIGITQISEGCLGNCNYCIVKLIKRKLFSYPEEKILENIKHDLKQGCREIWLTSQDNAAYGLDSDTNLINLLNKIINLEGKFKLRIGMMNPNHVLPILPELLEIYKNPKVYKFLHIPVQSGSNKILKSMNRKYTIKEFLNIIEKFRKEIPDITISTDIIVGYPGEGKSEFQETIKLLEKIKTDILNFTKYWPMHGTRAALLEQIPVKEAKNRVSEIQKLHLKIALEKNIKYKEKEMKVFVNEQEGTNCLARNENYKLIVIKSNKKLLGKTIKVKIKQSFSHYLLGELIN